MSSHSGSPAPRAPRARGEVSRSLIRAHLRNLRSQGQRPPTLDEIAEAVGLSKTTVHHHLTWMEERGLISISPPRREIILLDGDVP